MDLLSKRTSGTVDTRIMYAAEHEHLVIGFVAETAVLANFVHMYCYNNKMQHPMDLISNVTLISIRISVQIKK